MNHRATAHEQQRLEEGVHNQVKGRRNYAPMPSAAIM